MNWQMDPLEDPLKTRPIQIGSVMSIEPYPHGQLKFIDNPDRQFAHSSVPTRTRTPSDSPELLLTLAMPNFDTYSKQ
jgi:hypothetical protein